MEHTQTTKSSKKSHLNFEQMFDDQAKQVENNTHIQTLLAGNKKNTIENKIDSKLDHIEDLIKSMKAGAKAEKTQIKTVKVDNTPKKIYFYTGAIILAGLLIGIGLNSRPTIKYETIIEPVQTAIEIKNTYILKKFGNLRNAPTDKSEIITTLAPHLQVIELETNNNWVKVKFNDLLNNQSLIGWLYKPILKKID